MQRLVAVDGKVRTDATYPAGFMDVISIPKTEEYFRLLFDTHGRFVVHRISQEEAGYKLCKVLQDRVGKNAVPFIGTHDGRTIRFVDPDVKVRIKTGSLPFEIKGLLFSCVTYTIHTVSRVLPFRYLLRNCQLFQGQRSLE